MEQDKCWSLLDSNLEILLLQKEEGAAHVRRGKEDEPP
jgi:hypothetical protein